MAQQPPVIGMQGQGENKQALLEQLRSQDPDIDHIVTYSKFVVAYLLQQDGPNPGWRKANVEGPVYLLRRRTAKGPQYQVLVKNQFSTNDMIDTLHPNWELDCQKNYVFYKVEDQTKRIRGLWFHDDAERMRLEQSLETTLEDIRKGGTKEEEPQIAVAPRNSPPVGAPPMQPAARNDSSGNGNVTVTKETLSRALHALADDSMFQDMLLKKLADNQRRMDESRLR